MSRIFRATAVALILTVVFSFTGFYGQVEDIRHRVLRLHVLANSDSKEDQALKLEVRDAIVAHCANLFDDTEDEGQALAKACAEIENIEAVAQARVYELGYDYAVNAEVDSMYFTTREYNEVTLPAGIYDALRINIGAGAGKNWWCVVFPPMCVSAATEAVMLSDVLEDEQQEIVTEGDKYEVKFKIVEVFESICNWFS